ncbi:MAG: hypothetical protein M0Z77_08695 [Thermoplasmatales archaeon]|nr:hypothetical protein [Thermoplasmatales archaeon]
MESDGAVVNYQMHEVTDFPSRKNHKHMRYPVYYCTICSSFETPSWMGMKEHLKMKHNELAVQVSYRVRWEVG